MKSKCLTPLEKKAISLLVWNGSIMLTTTSFNSEDFISDSRSVVSWLKLFDAYNIKLDNKLELLPDSSD